MILSGHWSFRSTRILQIHLTQSNSIQILAASFSWRLESKCLKTLGIVPGNLHQRKDFRASRSLRFNLSSRLAYPPKTTNKTNCVLTWEDTDREDIVISSPFQLYRCFMPVWSPFAVYLSLSGSFLFWYDETVEFYEKKASRSLNKKRARRILALGYSNACRARIML